MPEEDYFIPPGDNVENAVAFSFTDAAQRSRGIARTSRGDDSCCLLLSFDYRNGTGPVLEGGRRLPAIILHPKVLQAQSSSQSRRFVQRSPTHSQWRQRRVWLDGQKGLVSPDAPLLALSQIVLAETGTY